MDQRAGFEARAVLVPGRARRARLALLVPVIALVAIAWAGVSGTRPDQATAEFADATAIVTPTPPRPHPTEVVGLDVHRLIDIQDRELGPADVVAVTGWYVPTAITDCPALAALYRDGSLPLVRGDPDELAFCERAGLLYNSRPEPNFAVPSVAVTLVVGVIVPVELEMIGAGATEVVVIGRLVPLGDGCFAAAFCHELVVDHVAWTSGV